MKPLTPIEDIIATIMTALTKITPGCNTIIAGDMNCRMDVNDNRSRELLQLMAEEGFTLINNKNDKTYLAHNGSSTIDLIFYKGSEINLISHKVGYSIKEAHLKKHIPVTASFSIKQQAFLTKERSITKPRSRKFDVHSLSQQQTKITDLQEKIEQNDIDAAAEIMEDIIKGATSPIKKRRSQKWFDRTCYLERKRVIQALHKARISNSREDLTTYSALRKQYKTLLRNTRNNYIESEAIRMVEETRENPYRALKPRKTQTVSKIDMDIWEEHFTDLLNQKRSLQAYPIKTVEPNSPQNPFTSEEIGATLSKLKDRKACGPDGIFNEHIKSSAEILLPTLTNLLNACLRTGNIPTTWKTSTIKVMYKGKGDPCDPNSYRGIALENNHLKILTRLITQRITEEIEQSIPEEQFGFRKGRNTIQAIRNLLDDIDTALRHPRGKFHAVFIDFSKAFDKLNRSIISSKLESIAMENKDLTCLIHNILSSNSVQISDSITLSTNITQTNGVLQGDPLSPLLFNIATHDVVKSIREESTDVKIYIYADDMVLGSHDRSELQKATYALEKWADQNELEINMQKTEHMIFRKGGKISQQDKIFLKQEPLQTVNQAKYLGLTLQTTTNSFRVHTKQRATAATKAIHDIRELTKLSLKTAMIIFHTKIVPILTYGLDLTWDKLRTKDLHTLENVKARFLKAALGVSKHTLSRLVYVLAHETFLIEELRTKLDLPSTSNWKKALDERIRKREDIWEDFYTTEAMINRTWTDTNQKLRHFVTSLAVHGYHHKICRIQCFHEPDDNCVCVLCNKTCDRYHILVCGNRQLSVINFVQSK